MARTTMSQRVSEVVGVLAFAASILWLVALVSEIRSVRSEMNVPAGAKVPLVVVGASKAVRARAEQHEETIKRLARVDALSFDKVAPKGSAQIVLGEMTAALPLAGEKSQAEIKKVDAKLANASFVAKAPPEVVEENRERKADFEATVRKLQAALKRVETAA